ncbi:hypothetical protein [Rhodopirellula baltica]|uniref:hypothetical protein n=1 Tax=Rhodopirellula baltica TaxID=265606 RepID=UPI0036F33256
MTPPGTTWPTTPPSQPAALARPPHRTNSWRIRLRNPNPTRQRGTTLNPGQSPTTPRG